MINFKFYVMIKSIAIMLTNFFQDYILNNQLIHQP